MLCEQTSEALVIVRCFSKQGCTADSRRLWLSGPVAVLLVGNVLWAGGQLSAQYLCSDKRENGHSASKNYDQHFCIQHLFVNIFVHPCKVKCLQILGKKKKKIFSESYSNQQTRYGAKATESTGEHYTSQSDLTHRTESHPNLVGIWVGKGKSLFIPESFVVCKDVAKCEKAHVQPDIKHCVRTELMYIFGSFQNYCVAVFLVRKLSADTLLNRLKHSGQRHPDHTRALSKTILHKICSRWQRLETCTSSRTQMEMDSMVILISVKEKLRPDPDSEIATTSLRVSLNCPVSKFSSRLKLKFDLVAIEKRCARS